MTNPQLIIDRLTAWVEKQSSVGPAAFRQALAEIRRDVEREAKAHCDVKPESIPDASGVWALIVEWWETYVPDQRTCCRELRDELERQGLHAPVEVLALLTEEEAASIANAYGMNRSVEPLVQELGTALGEFARDELGTTAADVDAAIAADKEHERAAKPVEVFNQQDEDAKLQEALGSLSEETAAKLAERMTPGEIIRAHELWKWLSKAVEPVATVESEPKPTKKRAAKPKARKK